MLEHDVLPINFLFFFFLILVEEEAGLGRPSMGSIYARWQGEQGTER